MRVLCKDVGLEVSGDLPSRFYLPSSQNGSAPSVADVSSFVAWLNSDAPKELMKEVYGPEAMKDLSVLKEIFQERSAVINKTFKLSDSGYILYPLAGADFTSPFLFKSDQVVMCDVGRFFYENTDKEKRDIFDFIKNMFSGTKDLVALLTGVSHGYDNVRDYGAAFSGGDRELNANPIGMYPVGYLGLLRLKLLLGAQDINVQRMPKDAGYEITFKAPSDPNDPTTLTSKTIKYYDRTYFEHGGKIGRDSFYTTDTARSIELCKWIKENKPGLVHLKGAHDFAYTAHEFWDAVDDDVAVVTDNHDAGLGRNVEVNPKSRIDYEWAKKYPWRFSAGFFGYGSEIHLYSADQFKTIFNKKCHRS
jgi:hypothetical protein